MKKRVFLLLLLGLSFALPSLVRSEQRQTAATGFFIPTQTVNSLQTKETIPVRPQINYNPVSTANNVNSAGAPQRKRQAVPEMYLRRAPIDKILAVQPYSREELKQYKSHIISSNYLLPAELKKIITQETKRINNETARIRWIKQNWQQQSPVYRFVNYELIRQIDSELKQSRQAYQNNISSLRDFLEKAPKNKYISLIEAHDDLFWLSSIMKNNALSGNFRIRAHSDTRYASVFDHKYKHVFSYYRLRADPNYNRRIVAANSGNRNIDAKFQKLFDDYKVDLRRLQTSLDITNPSLFRQIGEMRDNYITVSY